MGDSGAVSESEGTTTDGTNETSGVIVGPDENGSFGGYVVMVHLLRQSESKLKGRDCCSLLTGEIMSDNLGIVVSVGAFDAQLHGRGQAGKIRV